MSGRKGRKRKEEEDWRAVAKRPVVVHIAGQRYVVRSDADETYVQTLAEHVDKRMREVQLG